MNRRFLLLSVLTVLLCLSGPLRAETTPKVLIRTNFGDIGVELFRDQAPITVENFLWYVEHGYYGGVLFHRVIAGFMIQTGGFFLEDNILYRIPTNPPIINESDNGLSNLRGTVAMARTTDPNSASSQFYINHVDNLDLDRDRAADGVGYCVFGRVISGMDVVDAIAAAEVRDIGYGFSHFPYPSLIYIIEAVNAPPGYWLDADLNNDGQVNMVDYALFAQAYGAADPLADLDGNEILDSRDIARLAEQWARTTAWFE